MKGSAALLFLPALCASCAGLAPPAPRPVLEDQGGAYIYLAPGGRSPDPAAPFQIAGLAALAEDGDLVPLTVSKTGRDTGPSEVERLVAWGPLPPGRYSGLQLTWEAGGDTPESATIAGPFTVARRRGSVLTLQVSWLAPEGGPEGVWLPSFAVFPPAKPAPALIALASCSGSNHLAVFDKLTGRIAAIVPTGSGPLGLAIQDQTKRAFVALAGDDAVEMVDLLDNAVLERLRLAGGDEPADLAFTSDQRTLLCVNRGSGTVSFLDAIRLSEIGRIAVGQGAGSLVVDDIGRRAFVFNTAANTISVLDIPGQSVVRTLSTDSGPLYGAIDRTRTQLFVVHDSSPFLSVIDLTSLREVRKVNIGGPASALAVDRRSGRLFLARRGASTVEIFDPLSGMPVDLIPAGGEVAFLAFDPESSHLFLALRDTGRIQIVNQVSKKVVAVVEAGEEPARVAAFGRP